jgi:hypothetical protein
MVKHKSKVLPLVVIWMTDNNTRLGSDPARHRTDLVSRQPVIPLLSSLCSIASLSYLGVISIRELQEDAIFN